MKIVLFTKFVWADRATERFRGDLVRLAVKDPYGDYYQHPGYRYQTVTQLLDINTRRLIPMCFASPEWIQLCRDECLLYRYVVSYEPYNFKGRLRDMPRTVAYGQKMDALRTGLREWLWDGEFQDTLGARVTERGTGRPHAPFAVFRSARDSSLAVVAANYGTERDTVVDVDVAGSAGPYVYRLVDDGEWRQAAGGVRLPPRSAAVVLADRVLRSPRAPARGRGR